MESICWETDLLAYETCLVISKYPRQENQLIRIMCIRAGIISVSVKTFVMKFWFYARYIKLKHFYLVIRELSVNWGCFTLVNNNYFYCY